MVKYQGFQDIIKAQLKYVKNEDNTIDEATMIINVWTRNFIKDYVKILLEKVADNVVVDASCRDLDKNGYPEDFEVYVIRSSITNIELPKIEEI